MTIVLALVAAAIVFAIAAATVGTVVARLADAPRPTVLQVDESATWIADRLPFEIAAEISHDDVRRILDWHLDYFADIGLATDHGQELGGSAVPLGHAPVVGSTDESIDYVVSRALAEGAELTALQVVVVLDKQMEYWQEIGAIGPRADPEP
jgi:hypothetical protein